MKILVTGGAGYIGSVLVPELLNAGHEVTVIDNFMYNQTSLLDCCHRKNFTILNGDVRSRLLFHIGLSDTDVIIPLAAFVGALICDKMPTDAKSINYDAIELLLEVRSQNQQIIFPTTNSGYGMGQDEVYCTEESPLLPLSLYAETKVNAEKKLLDNGNVITLRLATAFGISPRMRLDLLVNDFVYRAVTEEWVVLFEGHFRRNYIHVRDIVRAFIHCLNNFDEMKDEPYNVGLSDANISKRELCEEIKKQLPNFQIIEAEVGEDPDRRNYIVSNAKIEATGFNAIYSLADGIAELIKGFQIIRRNQFSNV